VRICAATPIGRYQNAVHSASLNAILGRQDAKSATSQCNTENFERKRRRQLLVTNNEQRHAAGYAV
jgi:hypothetical protein